MGLHRELTNAEKARLERIFNSLAPSDDEQAALTPGERVRLAIRLSQRAWVLAGLPLPDALDRKSARVIDRETGEVIREVRRGDPDSLSHKRLMHHVMYGCDPPA
jgi:hypothetical protein